MKTFSAAKPVNRKLARYCVLINQCATPGLGSLVAGRRLAGVGQLIIAVAGFCLIIAWMVLNTLQLYNQAVRGAPPQPVGRVGIAGTLIFAASWLWAWVTSYQILRTAVDTVPPNVPPVLH